MHGNHGRTPPCKIAPYEEPHQTRIQLDAFIKQARIITSPLRMEPCLQSVGVLHFSPSKTSKTRIIPTQRWYSTYRLTNVGEVRPAGASLGITLIGSGRKDKPRAFEGIFGVGKVSDSKLRADVGGQRGAIRMSGA